jgi:hypothetical protein
VRRRLTESLDGLTLTDARHPEMPSEGKGRVLLFQRCHSALIPEGILRYLYNLFPNATPRKSSRFSLCCDCCHALTMIASIIAKTRLCRSKAFFGIFLIPYIRNEH